MRKVLCPEEVEVIERILTQGFKVEHVEGKGTTLEVILFRETILSKQSSRVETIVSYFYIEEGVFKTDFVHYTREVHTNDGKVKLVEEESFESFGELVEKLKKEEMPIPA